MTGAGDDSDASAAPYIAHDVSGPPSRSSDGEASDALGLDGPVRAQSGRDPNGELAAAKPSDLGADRAPLEAAFGTSLGDVQLYSGEPAARAADGMGARAYARGDDVVLPDSFSGDDRRHVLAHEVAHVVQQRGGTGGGTADAEHAADRAAQAFVAGEPVPSQPSTSVGIARFAGPTVVPTVRTTPQVGNQNAHQGNNSAFEAARQAKSDEEFRELYKNFMEKPEMTVASGGAPPNFVSKGETQRTRQQSPATQIDVWIEYTLHRFHAVGAIIHDIALAKTIDEIDSLWSVYLENSTAPRPQPWAGKRETERWAEDGKTGAAQESKDGPAHYEPRTGAFKLPSGSAAHYLRKGFVSPKVPSDDADGEARYNVLLLAAVQRAEEVPAIAIYVPTVSRSRNAKAEPSSEEISNTEIGEQRAHRNEERKAPIPTLHLPQTKEPHLLKYWQAIGEGKLQHDINYDRDDPSVPAHDENWTHTMLARAYTGITPELMAVGLELAGSLNKLVKPNWSKSSDNVDMSVDHIVELQVTRPEDRGEFDAMPNYELLDLRSNKSAGSRLKAAVAKERRRLAEETGDADWLTRVVVFKSVVADGGGPKGERWTDDEIASGEQIRALVRLRGG